MVNYVRVTPRIAIPEYMRFLLELRKPVKCAGKAVEAGPLPSLARRSLQFTVVVNRR